MNDPPGHGPLQRFILGPWQALVRWLLPQDASLQVWREKIFFATFLCSVALGLVPLLSSLNMALQHSMWGHFGFYLGSYLWAAALLLARGLPFKARAWCGVLLYFTLGLVALLTLGPAGSGRSWFFAACVLASLLLGLRAGVAALAAITASLFLVGHLMETGAVTWPLLQFYSPDAWRTTNYTLLMICAVATVSQAVLVEGLDRALDKEKLSFSQLEASNAQLKAEVAVREKAEADLRRHQEGLESAVEERTAELADSNHSLQLEVAAREEAEKALRLLASGVAHNFNNILMAILSNIQAAQALTNQENHDPAQVESLLDRVAQATRGGKDVVRRLSRFVARGSGRLPSSEVEVVDVGPLLRSLTTTVAGMREESGGGLVGVRLDITGGLFVKAVAGDLMEVFLNLAKNACDAMPGGGVLEIKARTEDGRVVMEFTDSGAGADPATLARFFDPFFSTKGSQGQGLGLAVSRVIVQGYGGELTARSLPGRGATLTVRLPLSSQAPLPPRKPQARTAAQTMKILLVEDEGLVAMGMTAILRSQGHQVEHAHSMGSALAALGEFHPDLAICDLGLPDASGWEICSSLADRAHVLGLGELPIVVVSGWDQGHLLENGAPQTMPLAYLQKPVERDRLLEVVGRAAKEREGE